MSVRDRDDWAGCEPPLVGTEFHTEPRIVDTQIPVSATRDRLRNNLQHLLGHDAHISFVAAVVVEAIEAEAIVETAEQRDVVLEPNVRSSSTATTTAAATTTTAATATGPTAGAASAAVSGAATSTTTGTGAAASAACAAAAVASVRTSALTLTCPAGLRG